MSECFKVLMLSMNITVAVFSGGGSNLHPPPWKRPAERCRYEAFQPLHMVAAIFPNIPQSLYGGDMSFRSKTPFCLCHVGHAHTQRHAASY